MESKCSDDQHICKIVAKREFSGGRLNIGLNGKFVRFSFIRYRFITLIECFRNTCLGHIKLHRELSSTGLSPHLLSNDFCRPELSWKFLKPCLMHPNFSSTLSDISGRILEPQN